MFSIHTLSPNGTLQKASDRIKKDKDSEGEADSLWASKQPVEHRGPEQGKSSLKQFDPALCIKTLTGCLGGQVYLLSGWGIYEPQGHTYRLSRRKVASPSQT